MSNTNEGFAFYYYLKSMHPDDYLEFTDSNTSPEKKESISNYHSKEFAIWSKIPTEIILQWEGRPPQSVMKDAENGKFQNKDNSNVNMDLAFCYYLKSMYPSDYLKFIDGSVSEDVKNSIISRHAEEFDTWQKVPYDVLLHWNGNPPKDIMVAASRGDYRKMQLDPFYIREQDDVYSDNYQGFAPKAEEIMATTVFVAAIDHGYSHEASLALAQESMFRELMRDKALNNTMTADEREIWRKSREKTRDIIRKDWAEYSPEKLLLHVFAKYNRGKISAAELSDTTRELMSRIESSGRHEELFNLLSSPRVQRRLARFDEEVLNALSQTILSNITLTTEQAQNLQARIASRNISRNKREMTEHLPNNLTAKQRIQNIPSSISRERSV
ncbi:MAG: hypothetical protein IKO06_05750 [Alphaproteobacteria bacterium]|nr:hypothetical protein [Alphaproteobacteria bacterium]